MIIPDKIDVLIYTLIKNGIITREELNENIKELSTVLEKREEETKATVRKFLQDFLNEK